MYEVLATNFKNFNMNCRKEIQAQWSFQAEREREEKNTGANSILQNPNYPYVDYLVFGLSVHDFPSYINVNTCELNF
jgi:hypothetical protein